MWVQLIVISLATIIYLYYRIYSECESRRVRKEYVVIVSILLILQSGLRNYSVGEDTYSYLMQFIYTDTQSWSSVFRGFVDVYIDGEGKDPGYPFFVKVCQLVLREYSAYLLLVAFIFFTSFGHFVYRNTRQMRDVLIIVVLYQALFYDFFSITGIRQVLAVSFTLWGFQYIKERKLLKFMLLMLPAISLHLSSLVFVPFYFIGNIKSSRMFLVCSLVLFPILVLWSKHIVEFIVSPLASTGYASYSQFDFETDGALGFALFFVMFILLSLLFYRGVRYHVTDSHFIYNALSVALVFTPLTWVDPSFMRLVQYFSIFMLLMLPSLIDFSSRSAIVRIILYLICMFFLVVYIVIGDREYKFVWQTMEIPDSYLSLNI